MQAKNTELHVTSEQDLTRIQAQVRRMRKEKPHQPLLVVLHGGRYELSESLVFGPKDGGSDKAPITWTAAVGERPVISGARRLGDWKQDKVNGVACLTIEVPKGGNPLQLFIDGRRAERARLPKTGWLRIVSTFGKSRPSDVPWGNGPDEVEYREGDLPKLRNLEDVRWVGMGPWFEMPMRIVAQDEQRRSLKLHRQTWSRLRDEKREWCRYRVENVAEALTEPGEWYHDRPAGKLHYIPLPGQTAENITTYAPAVDRLIHVRGASHLRFENLTFHHCDWHPLADYRGSIQAGHLIPGAILLEKCERCVLYGCEVAHVGGFGVELGVGSHDCRVVACTLFDLGGGGVRVDHEWLHAHSHEVEGDPAGVRGKESSRAATVSDCAIHHGGRIHPGAVGIYVGNAGHCRILHNEIFEMRYSGISVGWMWGNGPTATADNRIEFNHVHHINMERWFSDLGLIYTLGAQPGSTIRNNHLHHVASYDYGGNGIYTDEGSAGFIIENNLVHHYWATGFGGGQRDVVVRNNVFAWGEDFHAIPGNSAETFASWFENNIVAWRKGSCGSSSSGGGWSLAGQHATGNVLWAEGIPLRLSDGHDLAYWQQQGQLLDTLVADPLFADPDGGDFRLRADSPAIAHGFKPMDISTCGPRGGAARPLGYDAWRRRYSVPAARPALLARFDQIDDDRVLISIRNVGRLPASADFRLRAAKGVRFEGPAMMRVKNLAPDKEIKTELRFQVAAGTYQCSFWPSLKYLAPAVVNIDTGNRLWRVTRIQALTDPAQVPAAMAEAPGFTLTHEGREYGVARVAIAGDKMALWFRMCEPRIAVAPLVNWWDGSCTEIYVAPGFRGRILQMALLPDAAGTRLTVIRMEAWFSVPHPEVAGWCQPVEGGYECAALIPLELLGLTADEAQWRLELAAGVRTAANGPEWIKAQWMHAPGPQYFTRGMAKVESLP